MARNANSTSVRSLAVDAAVAAALMLFCVLSAPLLDLWNPSERPVDAVGFALIVAATAAIALRRRWPLAVLTASTLATAAYLALGYPYGPVYFAVAIAVYTVGRECGTRTALLASAGAYGALLVHLFTNDAALEGALGAIPAAGWVAIPLTIGIARRLVVEAQARERAESVRRRLDEERLRLAHEVHDVVGHGLAAIQMQADIALHLAQSVDNDDADEGARPGQAYRALETISRASAAALGELRATLGSIAPGEAGSPVPAPGLDRVDELCGRIRDGGVDVRLVTTGVRRQVAPEVDVAAYRIVQESLTNVVKHAAKSRATVEITYAEASVDLTVTSPREGLKPLKEGFGIRGMRHRVEDLGGRFSITTDRGEVIVRAVIPTAR